MTRVAGAALVLFAALAQVTWAQALSVEGVFPNFVLVVVVAIAWTYGERPGLAAACLGGLLLDLAAPGPLGPHAIALLCGAYVAGVSARNVERAGVAFPAVATALLTVIYSIVLVGVDDTLDLSLPPLAVAARVAGLAAVYNAFIAVPVIIVMSRSHREVHA
jgi:rod shape-determining protein MreD